MTPQEYAAQQALITAALLRFITQFGVFFRNPLLTVVDWIGFLRLLYPEVAAARERSASLARDFYDFQRALAHPELPRLARELEPYRFDWFVDAMEPAREVMSKPEASDRDLGQVAALAVREVENAGRRQIIHAVRADKPLDDKIVAATEERKKYKLPDDVKSELLAILQSGRPQERPTWGGQTVEEIRDYEEPKQATMVKGWARVATGRETCAFCLALISRGVVYEGASEAGLDLPDSEALNLITAGEDISEYMDQWHERCDCKVVPVFDLENWFGRDASQKAYSLWEKATEKAIEALEDDPDKMYYSFNGPEYGPNKGKPGWYPTTLNREAMNQLRKMLAAGAVKDWAALHAA